MIVRNGKTAAGWRLDEIKADMAVGMDMLMNPFAIVPKEENAERIVKAFAALATIADALESRAREHLCSGIHCSTCSPMEFVEQARAVLGRE